MTRGQRIRKLRLADPAISQQRVAKAIRVDRSLLARWELGCVKFSASRADQVANAIARLRDGQRFADSILVRTAQEARRLALG